MLALCQGCTWALPQPCCDRSTTSLRLHPQQAAVSRPPCAAPREQCLPHVRWQRSGRRVLLLQLEETLKTSSNSLLARGEGHGPGAVGTLPRGAEMKPVHVPSSGS